MPIQEIRRAPRSNHDDDDDAGAVAVPQPAQCTQTVLTVTLQRVLDLADPRPLTACNAGDERVRCISHSATA